MLDIRPGKELEAIFQLSRNPSVHYRTRALYEDHDERAEDIEENGYPDECLFVRLFHMNTSNPQRGWDQRDDSIADHASSYHGDGPRIPEQARRHKQSGSEVERYKRCVCVFECRSHVRRKPQQTCQDQKDRAAPQHIIAVKPTNQHANIAPELPAHDERNRKPQQGLSSGMFSRRVASNRYNTHVKQIDEQLIGSDFLRLFRAPKEPLVEVLPHNRLLVEPHGFTEFALSVPCVLVKRRRLAR